MQLGGRCADKGQRGAPGTLCSRRRAVEAGGAGAVRAQGGDPTHPGDKPQPQQRDGKNKAQGRAAMRGKKGRGCSYLGTGRCRRVSSRGPHRHLGRSTRARRRRRGSCSCCDPRRLREARGRQHGDLGAPIPPPTNKKKKKHNKTQTPRTHLPGARRRARSAPPAPS